VSWPLLANAQPQAWRSMCGCAYSSRLAQAAPRSIKRAKPAVTPLADEERRALAAEAARPELIAGYDECPSVVDLSNAGSRLFLEGRPNPRPR
jgi:hypothetical protein